MSTMEYKVCLRVALPKIKSRHEHYEWFLANVGEPASIESDDDGKVEYFSYEVGPKYERIKHTEPFLAPCEDEGDTYGVELIISHTQDDGEMVEFTRDQLDDLWARMEALPDIGGNIKLHSYSWYNGGAHDVIKW